VADRNLTPAVLGETACPSLGAAGVSQSPLFVPSVVRGVSPAQVLRKMLTNWSMTRGGTQGDIRSNPRRHGCRNGLLKPRERDVGWGGVQDRMRSVFG